MVYDYEVVGSDSGWYPRGQANIMNWSPLLFLVLHLNVNRFRVSVTRIL